MDDFNDLSERAARMLSIDKGSSRHISLGMSVTDALQRPLLHGYDYGSKA